MTPLWCNFATMTTQTNEVVPEWTVGDRLRKARQVTGLTTREFAERIGVSQKTITSAENDVHAVRKITFLAWSMATGVPVEWLQTGDVEGTAKPRPDGPDGAGVRHLGLEPRTRWFEAPAAPLRVAA